MRAIRFITVRVATAAATLLGVSVLVFGAIHLAPGSYEQLVLGPTATPEGRAHLADQFGLDKPLPVQFAKWLGNAVQGDLGVSLSTAEPIRAELVRRAPVTIELTVLATALSVLLGVPFGILAALGASGGVRGGASRVAGALAMGTPDFVIGSVLVYVFSRYALGLEVGGYTPFSEDPVANLRSMALPALTLAIFASALVTRTTRTAVLDVLSQPYITAAVARGEAPRQIVRRHVLRNAAIPVLTVVGTNVGYLLGGAVIVEVLFSLPGFGSFTVTAIQLRDYAVVQAGTLVAAAAFIAANLAVDLSYVVVDRRIL